MPRLIDLSHTVEDGMITYKGLPAPIVCDFLSREASRALYAPGVEFHIGKIEMVANTGTYLDSPFHRYADGKDLSQLDLATLAELEAWWRGSPAGRSAPSPAPNSWQHSVDRSARQGCARRNRLVQALAHRSVLRRSSVPHRRRRRDADSRRRDTRRHRQPQHRQHRRWTATSALHAPRRRIPDRRAHDRTATLPLTGFRFSAVPVKVKGMGTFPVRAYASIPD